MSNLKKIVYVGFIIGTLFFLIDWVFGFLRNDVAVINQTTLINFGIYQMYSIVLTFVNSYFFEYIN